MIEDLADGRVLLGQRSTEPVDVLVDPQPALFGALQDEDRGDCFADVRHRIRRVRRGANSRFDVLEAKPPLPDDLAVLDQGCGHTGDSALRAQ